MNVPAARGKGSKTIEEVYQKKTQLEHILLRPDTYVGSTEPQTQAMWVHDGARGLVHRTITYTPALYKIFDEILVNAADNKVGSAAGKLPPLRPMRTAGRWWAPARRCATPRWTQCALTSTPRPTRSACSTTATGSPWRSTRRGQPCRLAPTWAGRPAGSRLRAPSRLQEEGVYVPELIFGHLLTSSNYDDAEKKVTGGRNGYGAKLANIFSTEFVVETCDGK